MNSIARDSYKIILDNLDGLSVVSLFLSSRLFPFSLIDILREKWKLGSRLDPSSYNIKQLVHCLRIPERKYLFNSDNDDIFWTRKLDRFYLFDGTIHFQGVIGITEDLPPIKTAFDFLLKELPSDIKDIARGITYFLILTYQGQVFSVGSNSQGQLGLGDNITQNNPTLIQGIDNIIQVVISGHSSFLLNDKGRLHSCGNNNNKCLLLGDYEDRNTLTLIPNLNNIVQIYSKRGCFYAINNEGNVYRWGFGINRDPELIPNISNIVKISPGDYWTLLLNNEGKIYILATQSLIYPNISFDPILTSISEKIIEAVIGTWNFLTLDYDGNIFHNLIRTEPEFKIISRLIENFKCFKKSTVICIIFI